MKSTLPLVVALVLSVLSLSIVMIGCNSDEMLVPMPTPHVVTGAGGVPANQPIVSSGGGLGVATCGTPLNGKFTVGCTAATAVTVCQDGTGSCTPAGTQGACSDHGGVCRSLF